ncbi:MAG: hypothetical protein PWQ77_2087 [Kosmotogales bacterium]|nr:hypothetical protein [Kosmotogales bacterium]
MNILQITTIDTTINAFLIPLVKKLESENNKVVCIAKGTDKQEELKKQKIKFYSIDIGRNLNPFKLLKAYKQIKQFINREKIDIVHVHTPIASVIGRVAAKKSKCKFIFYTVHGFITDNKLFYLIEKYLGRNNTDYMFTVSEEDYNYAIEKKFISPNRIKYIHGVGIDTEKYSFKEKDSDFRKKFYKDNLLTNDFSIIGYVGRIVREKGILDLLNAFEKIRKEFKVKLLLVGEALNTDRDKKTKYEIKKIIDENNLDDYIIFTGEVNNVKDYLPLMDIFVLPSYREGMPVSLLEAMSMERACITTNTRGCREEIIDKYNGLIYNPGDVEELTEKLKFLLQNKELMREYGKKAREFCIKEFSKNISLDIQMKVYRKVIQKLNNEHCDN